MGSVRRYAEPRLLMTAAMAFFSIAMTLNVTGVRLSDLRWSSLRPAAIRSVVERRLTMASTPIIRYYDHSRLVYEVQARMRDLHRAAEDVRQEEENQRKQQEQAPGESKQAPARLREQPAEQSATPVMEPAEEPTFNDSEFLETSLKIQNRPALSGGSQTELRERSIVWIA
jgi:DNA primase